MPASLKLPSAWLSGGARAAYNLIALPASGETPTGPPAFNADLKPTGPPAFNADFKPTGPPKGAKTSVPMPSPAPFPLPWEGVDPEWVYGSRDALLAQALRKSRAKITRPADPRLAADPRRPSVWNWDSQFRTETLVCELSGRFVVQSRAVWMIDPGGHGAPVPTAHKVFEIGALPKVFPDEQIDKVLRAAVEREDRLPEILAQADDFWAFFESVVNIRLESAPRLYELICTAQLWGMRLLMGLKNEVGALRPIQHSSLAMPVITTPGHGSLPSGHATVSALNAELLRNLFLAAKSPLQSSRSAMLDRLARRIAFNRVVAGVHYPIDSLVGYALGTQLARVLQALADPAARLPLAVDDAVIATLDPGGGAGLLDKPDRQLEENDDRRLAMTPSALMPTSAPLLTELWRRACTELTELRA